MKRVLLRCVFVMLLMHGYFLPASLAQDAPPPAPPPTVEEQVKKAKQELKDAEARAALCQEEYDKACQLYEKGIIASEEVSKAEEALRRAQQDVQRARKHLEVAQKLTAPPAPQPAPARAPEDGEKPAAPPIPPAQTPTDVDADTKALLDRLEKELQQQKAALAEADDELAAALNDVKDIAEDLAKLPLDKDITTLHPFVTGARPYLGVPYVFGGTTSRGIDCSGLVMRVAQRLGLDLPHSAAALFQHGEPIAKNMLKPGDLVFFRDTYKPGISHVGIFLGKGRFLHASSVGKGVVISELDHPRYAKRYAGARRLLKPTAQEEKK